MPTRRRHLLENVKEILSYTFFLLPIAVFFFRLVIKSIEKKKQFMSQQFRKNNVTTRFLKLC